MVTPALPISGALEVLRLLNSRYVVQARLQSESIAAQLRAQESADETERLSLFLDYRDKHLDRQKDLIEKLIAHTQSVNDLKVQSALELFREAKSVIVQQHDALTEETKLLGQEMYKDHSDETLTLIRARQSEISSERARLDGNLAEFYHQCAIVIQSIDADIAHSSAVRMVEATE